MLNRNDFEKWLSANEDLLKRRIASWIPSELSDEDRGALLAEMKDDCLREIDAANQVRRMTLRIHRKKEKSGPVRIRQAGSFSTGFSTAAFSLVMHSPQT